MTEPITATTSVAQTISHRARSVFTKSRRFKLPSLNLSTGNAGYFDDSNAQPTKLIGQSPQSLCFSERALRLPRLWQRACAAEGPILTAEPTDEVLTPSRGNESSESWVRRQFVRKTHFAHEGAFIFGAEPFNSGWLTSLGTPGVVGSDI